LTKIGITGANGLLGSLIKKKFKKKKIDYSVFNGDINVKKDITIGFKLTLILNIYFISPRYHLPW